MKTLAILVVAGLAAATIVLWQQLVVLGRDDFQIVWHAGAAYKVFTYGFPLRLNDCNRVLDGTVHPSPLQTSYRMAANFLFFFLVALGCLRIAKKVWKRYRPTLAPPKEQRRGDVS